jgi:beta-N-acetylhexosaminidase
VRACVGWSRKRADEPDGPLHVAAAPAPRASLRHALLTRTVLIVAVVFATGCVVVPPDPATLARLDPEVGQLLLVGFSGTELDGNPELERLLCQIRVGGVLLFGRNIVDAEQLGRLTHALASRAADCTGRPLLIAVDAEGGRVMRLGPSAGFTATLSHRELGEDNDFAATELEARRIGRMLRDTGINWDLAPVVDVGVNPANPVIVGLGRSFSANPALVAAHAAAWIRGMHAAGILTALKHFPGHGSSYGDTHLGFVDVTDTANLEVELAPYRALIANGLADSVMTAHVVNRRLDPRYPATLSRAVITGLLRRRLAFRGPVVTDDLRMAAIERHYGVERAAVLALRAGADVLVIAEDRLPDGRSAAVVAVDAVRQAIRARRLRPGRLDDAVARVSALRSRISGTTGTAGANG